MPNMSYCRFRNTLSDLRDCYENWDDEISNEEEEKARERMLKLCQKIVADYAND